jgi:hypothetical protein
MHLIEEEGYLVVDGPTKVALGKIDEIPFRKALEYPGSDPLTESLSSALRRINHNHERFTLYPTVGLTWGLESPRGHQFRRSQAEDRTTHRWLPALEASRTELVSGIGGTREVIKGFQFCLTGGRFSKRDSKHGQGRLFRRYEEGDPDTLLNKICNEAEAIMGPRGTQTIMAIMQRLGENGNRSLEITPTYLAQLLGRTALRELDTHSRDVLGVIAHELAEWRLEIRTKKGGEWFNVFSVHGRFKTEDGVDSTTAVRIALSPQLAALVLRKRHLSVAPKALLTSDPAKDSWPNRLIMAISLEASRSHHKVEEAWSHGMTWTTTHDQAVWLRMARLATDKDTAKRSRRGVRGERSESGRIRAAMEELHQRGDIASWEVEVIEEAKPERDRITVRLTREQARKIARLRRGKPKKVGKKATKKAIPSP